MGFNIALIAIDVNEKDQLLAALNLVETAALDECNEMPISGGITANKKFVIWKNTNQSPLKISHVTAIKNISNLFIMETSETTMSGYVEHCKNGVTDWKIDYIGCENPKTFTPSGEVPGPVLDVHSELLAKQKSVENSDEVDYVYDVLSRSFELYSGVKYDQDNSFKFFELRNLKPKKAWWKIWG